MKKIPFQHYHLYHLLDSYRAKSLPLDLIIAQYFRSNKALGSKDRAFIADRAYQIIRWTRLLEYLTHRIDDWEAFNRFIDKKDLINFADDPKIPAAIRLSHPDLLYEMMVDNFGKEKANSLCLCNNERAPTTIRANTLKITRDALLKQLQNHYPVSPTKSSPNGIIFEKKIPLFSLPEFKEGLFEVQDEGSQLLAELVSIQPGQSLFDYCAGAGGKSLAIAPFMKQKGQLYLHDIRPPALIEAKKRLKRAGVQNAQIIQSTSEHLNKLKKKMDWVLVDAPCSGTGTLRRNPDMKWRFTPSTLPDLVGLQRTIFEKALSFVKPGGKIVYATCSMLSSENQKQVEHFMKTYPLELDKTPFQSLPSHGEMDGFFGAVFTVQKKDHAV